MPGLSTVGPNPAGSSCGTSSHPVSFLGIFKEDTTLFVSELDMDVDKRAFSFWIPVGSPYQDLSKSLIEGA